MEEREEIYIPQDVEGQTNVEDLLKILEKEVD